MSLGIHAWQPKTHVNISCLLFCFFVYLSPELLLNASAGCGGDTAVTLSSVLQQGLKREDV